MLDDPRFRPLWSLDPEVAFLNHGSFGSCAPPVMEAAQKIRQRIEGEPIRFLAGDLEGLLDEAMAFVGAFLKADPADLVFVPNATAGVSTVLRSLELSPGDELLTTDHTYNACKNALDHVAAATGARVVVARVPFPSAGPDEVVEAVLAAASDRTRLALFDQITSPTALIFPVDRLVAALAARGIDSLVDAAHGPGMVPLDLTATGAAYTTGNFHKWTGAPKVAAFLHVRRDKQARVHPLAISHGANSARADRSRFKLEHDWTGTFDPAPYLAVPAAIRWLESLLPGGLPEVMRVQRESALAARLRLAQALGVALPCPDEMVGSMATLALPDGLPDGPWIGGFDPTQEALFQRHRVEVPVFAWPAAGRRWFRVSTPLYVTTADVDRLAAGLLSLARG